MLHFFFILLLITELIPMINSNARYGHYGPGTFWCRHPLCTRREMVTASAVMNYGRVHEFHLTKRFYCCSSDVIYLLHCQACADASTEAAPSYSCHVGRCERNVGNLHGRIGQHFDSNSANSQNGVQIYTAAQLRGFIERGEDPVLEAGGEVRRDSHVHFNFEHPIGTKAARITVPKRAAGTRQENSKAEDNAKTEAGSYDYAGMGRGGLNKYGMA